MRKSSPSSSTPSSRSQFPAGGQPRTSGAASKPMTPVQGGQPRTGAGTASRPITPVQGAGRRNSPAPVSAFSMSSSSSPSSGTRSPSKSPPQKTTTITTTATAVPTTSNQVDHPGGLVIKLKSDATGGAETQVADHDPLFLAVVAAVNLGLKMLEYPAGKERLIQCLTGEGETEKSDWARPAKGLAGYVGSKAGLLSLNKFIFETIVKASEQFQKGNKDYVRTYELQMALMGITVAHELCHFFTGYLTGQKEFHTPPGIRYLDRDLNVINGKLVGESGRAWEASLIGGELRHLTEPLADGAPPEKHPLGYRQAGDLWLLNDNLGGIAVVDRECITALLKFDFAKAFPFRTTGTQQNIMLVKATRLRMDEMRNLALGKAADISHQRSNLSKRTWMPITRSGSVISVARISDASL
ncbi:hypothetical protein N657DRAFT_695958 [Parathielavia appendiculata]|uniref:Uncharacterized protein n=1 Tax=Parathielavia appendiculata TaxID=2587402 RepID=A0AAN6Z894_9PEZI|nr:hypothetical protein N657DRAFT_695958 [Parathielavia appendiculata]